MMWSSEMGCLHLTQRCSLHQHWQSVLGRSTGDGPGSDKKCRMKAHRADTRCDVSRFSTAILLVRRLTSSVSEPCSPNEAPSCELRATHESLGNRWGEQGLCLLCCTVRPFLLVAPLVKLRCTLCRMVLPYPSGIWKCTVLQ